MRRRFWGSAGGTLFGTLLLGQVVSATELEWSAPESCSEDSFVQQVEDNLQQSLAELTLESIAVMVTEGPSAWVLEFSLHEEGTERPPSRKLTGASCADVSGAAAVAVAMALHSRAGQQRASEPAPAVQPAAESPVATGDVSPDEREPAAPAATEESGPPYQWPIQLLLLGDVSLLGTPSYGLGVGVGVARGSWEGALSGAVLPKVELRTSDTLGMTLGASMGMAAGCFHVGGPPATPRVCLGYELGVVYGEGSGTGLRVSRQQRALWHALRPEVGLGVPLAPGLSLRLFAGAAVRLSRARFVYDAGRVAHEMPSISARGTIGVAWIL